MTRNCRVHISLEVKKCRVESLTLENIMTTYLKHVKCMKTKVNLCLFYGQEYDSPHLNNVLENILVSVHLSSKLANVTYGLSCSYLDFGTLQFLSILYARTELRCL